MKINFRTFFSHLLAAVLAISVLAQPAHAEDIGAPGSLRVISVGVRQVTLAWSQPSTGTSIAEQYQIQYSKDSGANWTTVNIWPAIDVTAAVITGLENGIHYEFRVRAQAEFADSPWTYALQAGAMALTQLDLSGGVACGVSAGRGYVYCWGYGLDGQLGNGASSHSVTPVRAGSKFGFVQVDTSGTHTCAVQIDGNLYCWGLNDFGQLGNGTEISSAVPVKVPSLSDVSQVALSSQSTCALRTTGEVSCWGNSSHGQAALGLNDQSSNPTDVGLTTVVSITAGWNHMCALLADSTVKCWGDGTQGTLGDGSTLNNLTPGVIAGLSGVKQLTAEFNATCALLTNGTIKCWGDNSTNIFGDGPADVVSPKVISGFGSVDAISTSGSHICAVLTNHTVQCKGVNASGQLGLGNTDVVAGVQTFATAVGIASVHTAGPNTCLVSLSGALSCVGNNWYGIHSVGTHNTTVLVPQPSTTFVGSAWLTPNIPGKVTTLNATFPKAKNASLTWTLAGDNGKPVTKYEVSWKKANAGSWGAWKSTGLSLRLSIKGLAKGVKYNIRIRATNAVGHTVSKTFTIKPTK